MNFAATLAAAPDTSVAPKGTSRRLGFYIGAGALFFPVFTNSSGGGVTPYSSSNATGGLAATSAIDFFPRFGTDWGLGVSTFVSAGTAPMPGGTLYGLEASATARGYYGRDSRWSVLGEAGYLWRTGGWSINDGFGTSTEGSASYTAWRVGTGVRRCSSTSWGAASDARTRFCKRGIDLKVALEMPSIEDAGAVPVFGFSMWWRGFLRVGVTVSPNYPTAGTPIYPLDGDRSGWLAVFQGERGWEFYSRYRRTGGRSRSERISDGGGDGEAVGGAAEQRSELAAGVGAQGGEPPLAIDHEGEERCRMYTGWGAVADECVRVAKQYIKAGGALGQRAPVLLEHACKTDTPGACSLLASLYYEGKVVAKDEARAASLYERACKAMDHAACYAAGSLYRKGVPIQSDMKALELFGSGCLGDHALSCRAQGLMERDGLGTPPSPHAAIMEFEKACKAGDAFSCHAAARLHEDGSLGRVDHAMAVVYYKEACGRGFGPSCSALAAIYEQGRDVAADPARAADYRSRACSVSQPDKKACGQPAPQTQAAGAP